MEENKNYTERRGTFIILAVAITVILSLVLTGIIVSFALERNVANYILIALIAGVILVGLISFCFLQIQKIRADNKRIAAAKRWSRHPDTVDRGGKFEPTAPPLSSTTSWAYAPYRYSQRATLLAGGK